MSQWKAMYWGWTANPPAVTYGDEFESPSWSFWLIPRSSMCEEAAYLEHPAAVTAAKKYWGGEGDSQRPIKGVVPPA